MLIPKIEISRTGKNLCINVKDVTGVYSENNLGGWGDPNLERTDVYKAQLGLLHNRKVVATSNVTDTVKASASAVIEFGCQFDGKLNKDGVYQVRYLITDEGGALFPFDDYQVIYVNDEIERHISKLWALLARITDVYNRKDLERECIWLDTNLNGLISLCNTKNTEQYLSLYKFIVKRLENIKSVYL